MSRATKKLDALLALQEESGNARSLFLFGLRIDISYSTVVSFIDASNVQWEDATDYSMTTRRHKAAFRRGRLQGVRSEHRELERDAFEALLVASLEAAARRVFMETLRDEARGMDVTPGELLRIAGERMIEVSASGVREGDA